MTREYTQLLQTYEAIRQSDIRKTDYIEKLEAQLKSKEEELNELLNFNSELLCALGKRPNEKARSIVAMLFWGWRKAEREYKKEYKKTWSDDCQLDILSEQAYKLKQCFEQSKKILEDNS